MAQANLVLPNGTKVNIEGTAEEVALLLEKFSEAEPSASSKRKTKRKAKAKKTNAASQKAKRKGPQQLIAELVEEGYFKANVRSLIFRRSSRRRGTSTLRIAYPRRC